MNRKLLLLLIGYVSLVFFVSTRPGLSPPGLGFQTKDKLAHFVEYAVMGGLIAGSLGGLVRSSRLGAFMFLVAVGAAIGAIDETLQGHTPERTMSVFDWFADLIGLGAAVAYMLLRRRPVNTGGESR
jgi:VanZ family protein